MQEIVGWVAEHVPHLLLTLGLGACALLVGRWWFRHRRRGVPFSRSRSVQSAFLILVACAFIAEENYDELFAPDAVDWSNAVFVLDDEGRVVDVHVDGESVRLLGEEDSDRIGAIVISPTESGLEE